jgi:transcriptional regulator with XRE-family HTH domain
MKPLEYDLKIIKIIKALRAPAILKQINLAHALDIDQSSYSRIERGDLAMTPGQLKIVANLLQTSHFQVLALADSTDNKEFKSTSLSEILIKTTLMLEGKTNDLNFTEDEMEFVISKIREKYAEMAIAKIFNSRLLRTI